MTLISQARDGDAAAASSIVSTTYSDDRHAVVSLRGDVDLSACGLLRAAFDEHLTAGRTTIRVDAGNVTFIDCRALGELVRAEHSCRGAAGTFRLTRASQAVRRLLQLTDLDCQLVAARPA